MKLTIVTKKANQETIKKLEEMGFKVTIILK